MGRIIIFPTDTVYGIGCNIFDIDSINKIYEIKGRSKDKPLACLCANLSQIDEIAIIDANAKKLINAFMPGALTLILKSKDSVYNKIGYKNIGVRIPNNETAINLLLANGPMLTTSVNDSGDAPLNNYAEIYDKYNNVVDYIYKDNLKSSNISSTVIQVIDGNINILREGQIKEKDIKNILYE